MGVLESYGSGIHGIGSTSGKRKSKHHKHDYSVSQHIEDNLGC